MGGGSAVQTFTRETVTANPNLSIVGDSVYDVSQFRNVHPGGSLFVSLFGGRDATNVFLSYHRRAWPAEKMAEYKVGSLAANVPATPQDPLYLELSERVRKAVPNGFAPWWYYAKVACLVGGTFALECYMMKTGRTWWGSVLQGLGFAWIGLNIQHDANHGSVSKRPFINRLLGLTQDYIGGSSILWLMEHDVLHHPYTNEKGRDPDVEGAPMFRMRPEDEVKPWFKYQHLYILPLEFFYGWAPIVGQIGELLRKSWAGRPISRLAYPYIKTSEFLKLVFFARFLALPLYFEPSLKTFGLISLTTAVGGFYLAFFFALSHNFEGVTFFDDENDDAKKRNMGFLERQVLSSSTVCGAKLGFFNGGLNFQIEHHLFPRIHHAHYPTLFKVVRAFCEEKGIKYTFFPTIWGNLRSMLAHLKNFGYGKREN